MKNGPPVLSTFVRVVIMQSCMPRLFRVADVQIISQVNG